MMLFRVSQVLPTPSVRYGFFGDLIDDVSDFFTETVPDFFTETIPDAFSGLGDLIKDGMDYVGNLILDGLKTFFGWVLFWACKGLCMLNDIFYSFFNVFAGVQRVTYKYTTASGQTKTERNFLLNIMLKQDSVATVFGAMAAIGILLAFVFTIWSVVKKSFDMYDQDRRTLGQILTELFKTVMLIVSMSAIMAITTAFTGVLMQSISAAFDLGTLGASQKTVVYTSEDYADMYDVLNTIKTYSLNPSYLNRYNLNSCYNAIRPKLQEMEERNLFDVYYVTENSKVYDGKTYTTVQNTWQSVLQPIVRAHNVDTDLKLDVYYGSVSNALLNAIYIMKTDASLQPLAYYQETYQAKKPASEVSIGAILMLAGTYDSAKQSNYNINPSITDAVRGSYYYGEKNVYDYDTMSSDFNTQVDGIAYLMIGILACFMLKSTVALFINAMVRLFHLIMLYLVSPLFIATLPLGESGSKFKAWKDAFVVTNFGYLGSVIGMRLLLLYIPLIVTSDVEYYSNGFLNFLAKAFLLWGGIKAAEKGTALLSGLLAGDGTRAAMEANNTADMTQKFMRKTGIGLLANKPSNVVDQATDLPSKYLFGEKKKNNQDGNDSRDDKDNADNKDNNGNGSSGNGEGSQPSLPGKSTVPGSSPSDKSSGGANAMATPSRNAWGSGGGGQSNLSDGGMNKKAGSGNSEPVSNQKPGAGNDAIKLGIQIAAKSKK